MILSSVKQNGGRIGASRPPTQLRSHADGFLEAGMGRPVAVKRSRQSGGNAIVCEDFVIWKGMGAVLVLVWAWACEDMFGFVGGI